MSRRPITTTEFLQDYQCSITFEYPFIDPVQVNPCGHLFDKKSFNAYLQGKTRPTCPCCRGDIVLSGDAPSIIKNALSFGLSQHPESYKDVHFDIDHFADVVRKNELNTAIGERFILVLEHADTYLNEAIGTLSTTLAGRDLLRKKLHIDVSGKFFFDRAEILPASLMIQTNGKSIREWLSMTTAMEKFEKDALERMSAIAEEERIITAQKERLSNQFRLFLSRGAQGGAAAAGSRMHSEATNPVLQHVAYGEEGRVRDALESVKSDPAQLAHALSDTGTVKDYSDRTITGMTLLQAAAAAGDIDMCLMLKNYMSPEEFARQLAEIFPEGIEAHESEQQRNTFNFDAILAAIRAANTPDLDAALNKTDNGSALCRALEEFRRQFSELSNNEKIFNPQHLLRAFEVYNALWDQCERDGSDRDYKKRDLFWRQIIGYTQRFMPACYAQAFSQGLYYLVKVDQPDSWRPEAFKRDLKLRCDNFSYFPLPRNSRSGLGFDFAIYGGARWRGVGGLRLVCNVFENFCRAKTAGFQNITPRVRVFVPAQSDERRCVVQMR